MSQPSKESLGLLATTPSHSSSLSTQIQVESRITSMFNAQAFQRNLITNWLMESPRLSDPGSIPHTEQCTITGAKNKTVSTVSMPSTAPPYLDPLAVTDMEQIQAIEREIYIREKIQETDNLLKTTSLALPETRLAIIYCHNSPKKNIVKGSAILHSQEAASKGHILHVAQRAEDVDYTMEIQLETPSRYSRVTRIKCQIVYDPGSDNCVLINRTKGSLGLANLCQSYSYQFIGPDEKRVIHPGVWGIMLAQTGDIVDDCLIKFLLRERRHAISICKANGQLQGGRAEDNERSIERHKFNDKLTKAIITCDSNSATDLKLDGEKNISTATNALLDLHDGDFATIRTPLSKTIFRTDSYPATYQLKRIKKIAAKPGANVFSCQHSIIPGDLAIKVLHNENSSTDHLVHFSKLWEREKTLLEKLRHRNIVSLKGCDGRLLALYLELLPLSLANGRLSQFRPPDAFEILDNISSALTYLEAQNIVHNDIKPSNIAYSPDRGAVLLDFGIASLSGESKFGGSPWYIPPELVTDERRYSTGDIWALGVTMLYVLQKIQYPEHTADAWDIREIADAASIARKKMKDWSRSIDKVRERLNRGNTMEYVVFRMLDRDRYSRITAAAIQDALKV